MRLRAVVLGCALVAMLCPRIGQADHEAPFYPSFYPQEIKIEALDAASAAAGWPKARVHAYVGDGLFREGAPPSDAALVGSLSSLVVLTFDAAYGRYAAGSGDAKARCAAASRILPALAQSRAG